MIINEDDTYIVEQLPKRWKPNINHPYFKYIEQYKDIDVYQVVANKNGFVVGDWITLNKDGWWGGMDSNKDRAIERAWR